jgi:hypothetical protein
VNIVIHPDGKMEDVESKPSLERLQELVGGYIELLSPSLHALPDRHVLVNEDGLSLSLPPNPTATRMVHCQQMLVGPVVICKKSDLT